MADKYIIHDIETLKHCFTCVYKDYKTKKKRKFVIHESRNDFKEFIKATKIIRDKNYTMVGFNSLAFDSQVIEYMLMNAKNFSKISIKDLLFYIYEEAQRLINLPEENKWMYVIPPWKLSIPQIDIFIQKHYNSPNKRTSLKWLEFTMRMHNVKSMPIKHDAEEITEEDVEKILEYNEHDVDATDKNFEINKFETDLRLQLSKEYDIDLMNASEPKLARDIFGKIFCRAMGISYKELKKLRTNRNVVKVKELIFPKVKFKNPTLNLVKNWYESLRFNPYAYEDIKKEFNFANLKCDVGLGGIHGCVAPGVYTNSENHVIHDWDVASYYPNLGIKNNLYPQHLSHLFGEINNDLFQLRKTIPKENPVNYALKIVLNSAYGQSQEPNSYFHDPNYAFTITVNGQLFLLMLGELLKLKVPDIIFYQFNTDGVTIGYDPKYTDIVKDCIKKWEKLTKLEMEDKYYNKMIIRDVNNYMAVDTKGKIKRKGIFGYSMDPADKEMDYHKNPSELIVPKALEAYYIEGKDYIDYIKKCEDIFDFCAGVKVKSNFDLFELSYNSEKNIFEHTKMHDQVVRYYVSNYTTSLKKKYKPDSKTGAKAVGKGKKINYTELVKGYNTTYFNEYKELPMKEYHINYDYYISEVRKIIDTIQPNKKQLTLLL